MKKPLQMLALLPLAAALLAFGCGGSHESYRERRVNDALKDIKSPDPAVRLKAVRTLTGMSSEKVLEPLMGALKDESPDVRVAAVRALASVKGERVDNALIEALKDGEPKVREAAADALGIRGTTKARSALADLAEKDPTQEVRNAALGAIDNLSSRQE